MAEHLGEMRLPAWRSKRWQDFHTLHIWLGKHSCCLIQANQILRWHQQTEPIQPETVVELLKGQQYKRCRLLLELPWIWLEAAETISVRTEEWPFYLRHHLQLPELPGPQQPVGWQHLKGSPPKTLLAQPDVQGVEVLPAFRTPCGKTHLTQVLCHRSASNDGGTSDLGIPKIPGGSATASFLLQYPEC